MLAPIDERGRIAAFLGLISRIEAAERSAECEIRKRGWHWGSEANRLVTQFKVRALSAVAGIALDAAPDTNPLEGIWEAVVAILPRVFCVVYSSREQLSDAERDELIELSEGRGLKSALKYGRLYAEAGRTSHLHPTPNSSP